MARLILDSRRERAEQFPCVAENVHDPPAEHADLCLRALAFEDGPGNLSSPGFRLPFGHKQTEAGQAGTEDLFPLFILLLREQAPRPLPSDLELFAFADSDGSLRNRGPLQGRPLNPIAANPAAALHDEGLLDLAHQCDANARQNPFHDLRRHPATTSAQGALEAVKTLVPDIIIIDLILPGMNGFDILEALNKFESIKGVPRMVLSNLSKVADIDKAKSLGAIKYLVKASTSLDQVIKEILEILK